MAVFSFWFAGMQVMVGMIADYRTGNQTGNLRP